MSLRLDPEYLKAIEQYLAIFENAPNYPIGDVQSRQSGSEALLDLLMPAWPVMNDVHRQVYTVKSKDGTFDIPLYHFTRQGMDISQAGPGIVYFHGGGFFSLSTEHYRKILEVYVSQTGIPIVAVDYRLAPDFPFPTPMDDAYAALEYISRNPEIFKIDPARIAVLGDSAGGGLAAGIAIKARDEGLNPPLAKQMLIGSMLDDRSVATKNKTLAEFATWTHESNVTGWNAYLRGSGELGPQETDEVSEYAVPGRVKSVKGLPPLYLECPDLDIFRDDNLEYASRIAREDIDTEVHVWKGVPHSFELFAPHIETTKMAIQCRTRAMRSI